MMNKFHVWTKSILTFLRTLSVYQILIFNVESFNLKCPSQAHWTFRAQANCNNTLEYYCLYNNIKGMYVEGCNGPDWDRKGSKRIYAGDFTRGFCKKERFQPFKFWTNGSMSDCVYAKSICSEDGQIVYKDDSAKDDRTCQCDYKRNYSFVKIPRQLCYCIPAEEDCSCLIKSCPLNFTLSADYECTLNGTLNDTLGKQKCKDTSKLYDTLNETEEVLMKKNYRWLSKPVSKSKKKDSVAGIILLCSCFLFISVACGFFFAVLSEKYRCEKQLFEICTFRNKSDDSSTTEREQLIMNVDEQTHLLCEISSVDKKQVKLTIEEVNFLRIIHLLFRVACPVVRMTFNHEIQPNQLQKMLDKKCQQLEKRYRNKKAIINDYQWNLLFKQVKGKKLTSNDFDVRLMIYLLSTLANIKVGDLYPVAADKSISAILSRIKYIRNEVTQDFEGKLTKEKFKQYWDDIGQALLELLSSNGIGGDKMKKNDSEKKQLCSRILTLNPINIDYDKLRVFIDMSEKYPSMILQQLISEYCTLNNLTIEELLGLEKHGLYHKRIKTIACCQCSPESFQMFIKVIQERQWEALFIFLENSNLHVCPSDLTKCSERFIPKQIDKCDLSVAISLVLNIQGILKLAISRLYGKEIYVFLVNNKHTIYHSLGKTRCCMCNQVPTGKTVVNKTEWDKLFIKDNKESCKTGNEDCCCLYSVIEGIKYSDMDDVFLSKLFYVAGPFSVVYKIGQDAFSYYLSWTLDEQPLRRSLTELLNTIENKDFSQNISQQISCQSDKTIAQKADAHEWVSRHVREQKSTTDPSLQILVRNTSGLTSKRVHIPKDFPLPHRTYKFTDLTPEENSFLVVVHSLSTIVFPIIKKEFGRKCPDNVLDKIRISFWEQNCKDSSNSRNKRQNKKIYLTQRQQQQLFPPKNEESKNLDMKLMIYILKQRSEEERGEGRKEYIDQLDIIDDIRREIVQSSSGILNETRFKDILERITEAVLHLGGAMYKEKLANLHHITNILE